MKNKNNQTFQQQISTIIKQYVDFPINCFVTITQATISSDQKYAEISISTIPINCAPQAIETLKSYRHEIKKGLAKKTNLRQIPQLNYKIDDSEYQAEQLENYIQNLKDNNKLN